MCAGALYSNRAHSEEATILDPVHLLSTFASTFLGNYLQSAPFLLIGTLISGLVEEFVDPKQLADLIPRHALAGTVIGVLIGFAFPVCEFGSVPLARRLVRKGLPSSTVFTFLLAAPIVNPIVIASTIAAFGFGRMFFARMVVGIFTSILVGIVFSLQPDAADLLRPIADLKPVNHNESVESRESRSAPRLNERFRAALRLAGDEYFDMGRYLIGGSIMAALVQTIVPRSALVRFGPDPVASVATIMLLALFLSGCSAFDAFVALGFSGSFTTGSVLSFLVGGSMIDIKSITLMTRVFKGKTVAYLIILPLLISMLAGLFVNLNLSW